MTNQSPTNNEVHQWLEQTANGDMASVAAFLDRGFDVNSSSMEVAETALMVAAGRGHGDIVDLLLARGANTNETDETGSTALHFAALGPSADVCQSLIAAGAQVDAVDDSGCSPLHYAARNWRQADNVRVLIQAGADSALANEEGDTPMMWATGYQSENIIRTEVQARELKEATRQAANSWSPADLSGDHLVPKAQGDAQSHHVQQRSRRL